MSTHAVKTELHSLLLELFPDVVWYKRSGVLEMSEFAVRNLDAGAANPKVQRALELARVMYETQRS